jgi:uncharacterized lipoprotein YajG
MEDATTITVEGKKKLNNQNVLEVYLEQFINELIELIANGFSIQNYLEEQKHN